MQADRGRHDMTNLIVPLPIVFLTMGKGCPQMAFCPFVPVETSPDRNSGEEARPRRVSP